MTEKEHDMESVHTPVRRDTNIGGEPQDLYRFDNGRGASVVTDQLTDLLGYHVMEIHWDGDEFKLANNSTIAGGIRVPLGELAALLDEIAAQPAPEERTAA
jgi:hypothetical protein